MATVIESDEKLKEVFKAAIVELLEERGDQVRSILEEIVEDVAFSHAIDEGSATPKVSREQVFDLLESVN